MKPTNFRIFYQKSGNPTFTSLRKYTKKYQEWELPRKELDLFFAIRKKHYINGDFLDLAKNDLA
ncbi:MAG: hypothetical protein ACPGRR_10695, partial [Pseudoalteromonas shioyasakiensis]